MTLKFAFWIIANYPMFRAALQMPLSWDIEVKDNIDVMTCIKMKSIIRLALRMLIIHRLLPGI